MNQVGETCLRSWSDRPCGVAYDFDKKLGSQISGLLMGFLMARRTPFPVLRLLPRQDLLDLREHKHGMPAIEPVYWSASGKRAEGFHKVRSLLHRELSCSRILTGVACCQAGEPKRKFRFSE